MLLRRMIDHVRAQNWTAIALDFVIVVAGVFIGIQVSNWNAERTLRVQEQAALDRLQEESEQAVAYWQEQVDMSASFNDSRRVFLAALDRGAMTEEEEQDVQRAMTSMFFYPANNPPQAVIDELLADGGLGNVSDPAVRDAISRYLSELAFIDGQLTQFRTNFPQMMRAYEGRVYSDYDPSSPSLRRFSVDLAMLSKDRQFRSDMVDLVRDQLQFHNYRVQVLAEADNLCRTVSAAIARTCEPDQGVIVDRTGVNGVMQRP